MNTTQQKKEKLKNQKWKIKNIHNLSNQTNPSPQQKQLKIQPRIKKPWKHFQQETSNFILENNE